MRRRGLGLGWLLVDGRRGYSAINSSSCRGGCTSPNAVRSADNYSNCPGKASVKNLLAAAVPPGLVQESFSHSASYWANGALNTLNPLNSAALPTITYGLDGEGRPNSAGASSGMNPVLSASYDVAGHATGVTLGTYDSDAYGLAPC